MFNYVWPIGLVVLSNVFYQVCAKSVPHEIDSFAALTIVYALATVTSFIFYYILNKDGNIIHEYTHLNWAPIVLGISVVGLEVGMLFAYKAGWPISIAQIVQATLCAIILIFVGYIIYKEPVTWNKIAGIFVCLAGLGLINMK